MYLKETLTRSFETTYKPNFIINFINMSVVQGRGTLNKAVVKRGPERFKATLVAHSGVDPLGAFGGFTRHDPIKNIDIKRDETAPVDLKKDFPWMQDRVPARTQTYTFKTGKLR